MVLPVDVDPRIPSTDPGYPQNHDPNGSLTCRYHHMVYVTYIHTSDYTIPVVSIILLHLLCNKSVFLARHNHTYLVFLAAWLVIFVPRGLWLVAARIA
jgi:hypothetical protein